MRKVYKVKSDFCKPDISYFSLYRFATKLEVCAVILSLFLSFISSVMLIAAIILYGELSGLFVDRTQTKDVSDTNFIVYLFGGSKALTNATKEEHYAELIRDANAFGVASILDMLIMLVVSAASVYVINWASARQIMRIRYKFLENILRQDMSFFDTDSNLNFASKITDDLEKIREGISEKVAMFGYLVNSVIVSCALSLYYGWELTLVGLSVVPLSIIVNAVTAKYQSKCSSKELETYSHAGRCVEEVLSGVRTVQAFAGEDIEVDRYKTRLLPLKSCGNKRSMCTSIGVSLSWFITYSLNSIIFYYGSRLIVQDREIDGGVYNPAVLVIILLAIYNAAQNIAMCSPHTETFATARGAAKQIFPLLDKKSKIDSLSDEGIQMQDYSGEIVFNDVDFNYPSRPNVKVLRSLNLTIKSGATVALVGESGCGKSTILQLIQRLYDPNSGKVMLEGTNIKDLNLNHFRSHIGVVGQEPVLFAGTIKDNILLGKPDATLEDITEAARKAFAHDFIEKLPDGYNTLIGENGVSLSGGQKQRIAIARSLIRTPKILILDEATSALDSASEREVQMALDEARKGRTTVVVTHRLSTVVNADLIVYIEKGSVLEKGTHFELLAKKGQYYNLVQNDMASTDKDMSTTEESTKLYDDVTSIEGSNGLSRRESKLSEYKRKLSESPWSELQSKPHPEEMEDEDETSADSNVSYWQLLRLNLPEWPLIALGCFCSLIVGGCLPIFALLFAYVFEMFKTQDDSELVSLAGYYSALFLAVAALCSLATFLQTYLFNISGIKLTTRLRIDTFSNFLKQEMSWFDDPSNSVGSLCARLSTDAASVQGATGTRIGTILQSLSTVFIGVLVALLASWKLTLVSSLSMPVVIGAVYLEGAVSRVFSKRERKSIEGATSIATEAIINIRTVQSMGIERQLLARYASALERAKEASTQATRSRGAVYAMGCAAPTLGFTISMYYGGWLIANGELEYHKCILVSEALIYGSWMLGQALSFAPNFASAKTAGERIIRLMERKPQIANDTSIDDKDWSASGDILYKEVSFKYPNRPKHLVLDKIDLQIEKSKTTALVGHSGSGKSTILQLIQRYYDVDSGNIVMDGMNVSKDVSLAKLRLQLGIVQQEPVLFDRTIAENIAYGDNSRAVNIEEIKKAATAANIHKFIVSLPLEKLYVCCVGPPSSYPGQHRQGQRRVGQHNPTQHIYSFSWWWFEAYETRIGSKGAQLSGGQKQRIAIARALVRNPKILLLDEATSALDAASEKSVQEALDAASKNRTCVVIAHRLATIQKADCIYVLDKGHVVEKGTHSQLINKKGHYYNLSQMQGNNS